MKTNRCALDMYCVYKTVESCNRNTVSTQIVENLARTLEFPLLIRTVEFVSTES